MKFSLKFDKTIEVQICKVYKTWEKTWVKIRDKLCKLLKI